MNERILVCAFCGTALPASEAQECGWVPTFFLNDTSETDQPACCECASEHLDDLDADPIIRPGHERFFRGVGGEPNGSP